MSKQPAQQAYVKHNGADQSALDVASRQKSKPNLGGYRPRTLQRVSLGKWEEDADLEQGEHDSAQSSVSCLTIFRLPRVKDSVLTSGDCSVPRQLDCFI